MGLEENASATTITLSKVPDAARRLLIIMFVLIYITMGLVVGEFVGRALGHFLLGAVVGAGVGTLFGMLFARALRGHGTPVSLTIDASQLRFLFPKGKIVDVPLEEVRSIEERGRNRRRYLVVNAKRRPILFRSTALGEITPEFLRTRVHAAVARLPLGADLVAAMQRRESIGAEINRHRPKVVHILIVCIVAAFAIEILTGARNSPAILLSLGGNSPVLVAQGEWWRLFTAIFLHANAPHLFLNYFALMVLGLVLEQLVGAWRMLTISLTAGLAGSIASALASGHAFSVGISGLIFGLLGALLVVNLRSREFLPAGFRIDLWRWAIILGLNLLIGLLPFVDAWAHLGGFIGGAVAAWFLVPADLAMGRKRSAAVVVGVLLGVGYVAAVSAAVLNRPHLDARADFLHAVIDGKRLPAPALNDFAWQSATDRRTQAKELDALLRLMARVVAENPRDANVRDTYAYLLSRNGRLDEAIAQERIALIDSKTAQATLYTMLHHFLMQGGRPRSESATVDREGAELQIDSSIPGAVIFACQAELGCARIILPVGVYQARVSAPAFFSGGDIPVWLVDGEGPEPRTSSVQIGFANYDARTAALP